jgi:hypothetical protein
MGGREGMPRSLRSLHASYVARFLSASPPTITRLFSENCAGRGQLGQMAALPGGPGGPYLLRAYRRQKDAATLLTVHHGATVVHKCVLPLESTGLAVCPATARIFLAIRTAGIGVWSPQLEFLGRLHGGDILAAHVMGPLCCTADVVAVEYHERSLPRYVAFLCARTGAWKHRITHHERSFSAMALLANGTQLAGSDAFWKGVNVLRVSDGQRLAHISVMGHACSVASTYADELVVAVLGLMCDENAMINVYRQVDGRNNYQLTRKIVCPRDVYRVAVHGDAIFALEADACVVFQ